MRLGTIALASRRSGKQHPKSTGATKSVGAAWLVTLWGSSSAAGTTAMAYSCATRSRASYQGVPAFAARLSSLRRSAMSAGSGRSWSGLGEETGTGGATNAPLGTTVVTPAMSLSRERPGSASRRANTEGSSLLLISSRGCWDWQEGCMGSRAGAGRGFSSGAGRRAFGPTCRRLIVAPSSSTSTGGGDGLVVFEAAELLKMGYRDLQKLAKENGVRANQTVEGMVKDLVGLGAKRGSIDDTDKDGAGFHKMSEEGLRSERGQGLSISAPPIDEVGDSSDDKNDLKLVRKSKTRASGVGKASGVRGKETASDMVRGLEKASAAAAAAAAAGVGDKGDGWVTIRLDGRGSDDSDALGVLEQEEEDYDEGDDSMEARLRDARASRDLSKVLMKANPEDYGFREDRITLDKLTITVPKGCCPGCGSKFQSEDDTLPGYLREDKLEAFLARADEADAAADSVEGYAMTSEDVDMDPKMWQSLKQQQQQQQQQPQDSSDVAPPTELQPGGDVGGAQLKHPLLPLTDPRQCDAPDSSSSIGSDIEALPEGEKGTDEENDRLVVCQRCHRLRCYGSVEESLRPGFSDSDLLTPTRFLNAIDTRSRDLINSGLIRWRMTVLMDTVAESGREEWRRPELLGTLKKQRCLIIYLVDLFDFHGTFLYNLPKITGTNPVLVAGNKVDLLPKDLKKERVTKWVRDKCREAGLPAMEMRDVHLISSKHGVGIAPLMRKAREQALRGKRDIYVLGAANVGKSTFINYIIEDRGDNGGGLVSSRRSRGEGGKRSVPGRGVTVSSVPGTTLDFLKVDLGEKRALYDTPGLLMPHTLTSRLTAEELRAAIPKKKVDHVTFRLGEGKVVLLGGLSRVEVVEGRPFLLTFFVSNDVRLHPTDVTRVEGMLSSHVGKDKMIFPPFSSDRVQELGDLVPTDFDIVGAGWRESAADVVIAGLGWVSVTGAGPVTLRVWAPRGVLVMAREPLLPFESWETTATFTGGATVKKGKKKQGRRA